MLAVSSVAANGLEVVVRVADFGRFPVDADGRRVIVWEERDPALRRVMELVERRGFRVTSSAPQKVRSEREPEGPARRGLSD